MRFLCDILFILLLSGSAAAQDIHLTPDEKAWLADHHASLVMSFDPNFPPVEFVTTSGDFTGMAADIIALIEQRLGVRFRKVPSRAWPEILEGLQNGTTALTPAIAATAERSELAFFTPPYIELPLVIVTSRSTKGTLNLDDLAGRRVAVVKGYASAEVVRRQSRGTIEIVEVATIQEGLRDVSFGVVDAFVESVAVAAWFIEQENLPNLRVAGDLGIENALSIGVSRHHPLLASAVSKALDSISPEELHALSTKWVRLQPSAFDTQTVMALRLSAIFTAIVLGILAVLAWILRRRLREKMDALEQAKAELSNQVERFGLALEATRSGAWEFFPAELREEHTPQWYTMLGYEPKAGPQTLESWTSLIHPEDQQRAFDTFARFIEAGRSEQYTAEYRMLAQDGSWRWILATGRIVNRDDAGKATRIIGLNLDIQRIKTAQEEMQRSQAMTKALLEQTTQFIGMVDTDGILRVANHTSLEWAGVEARDVIGKPFWNTPWWPDKSEARAMFEEIFDRVRTGTTVRREITQVTPRGIESPFDFTASPFRDEHGQITGCIVEGRDISDLKNKQRIIARSEARLRAIIDNAPFGAHFYMLAPPDRLVFTGANTAAERILGVEHEPLIGMDILEAFPQLEHTDIPDTYRRCALNGSVSSWDDVRYESGRIKGAYDVTAFQTLPGQMAVFFNDVTERKASQEALRRSEELFSRLFHLSPDMIALTRLENDLGKLLEVNASFTRFTGYTREEALGNSTLELGLYANPARREEYTAIVLRDQEVDNFEYDLRHRDGHILNCVASARIIRIDNTPCVLAVTRDISQLRSMQETMIQSEKMLSLGGIASGIAHEINNPLGIVLQAVQTMALRLRPDFQKNQDVANSLGLNMELLERYLKARRIDEFMRDIESAAVRAAGIIRHMLDFSRKSESRCVLCSITSIIENALSMASKDFDLKSNYDFRIIDIQRDYGTDLPAVECAETEIEQVLLNLLRNAAQAMAEAIPPVTNPRIRVSARVQDETMHIEIADNGPGILPEYQSRVFEPFFTTKATGAGTGLGLSVSYFIITKGHGGRMHVSSPSDGGTVFSIELPLRRQGA